MADMNWSPRVVEGEIGFLAERLAGVLVTPNESDRNGEPANVVDGLYRIAEGLHHVARAIEAHPR